MCKQIMVGMLANAELDEAMAKGVLSFSELYRIVVSISHRDGIGASAYVYDDVVGGLRNALMVSVDCGDPDCDNGWVYLSDVSWVFPDTDDDELYERLYTENVEALFDCLECVESVIRISKNAAEFLVKFIGEAVFYNRHTNEYAWVLPYFGMPWSLVSVDVVSE